MATKKTETPQNTFRLEQLFGSKTRARLLGLFFQNPDSAFFVRELTRKIGAQLNSVRRELKNLQEIGLVYEQGKDVTKKTSKALSEKKKYYSINKDFLLFNDLKTLFKKVQILLKQNLVQEIQKKGTIDFFAFTGRFVDSTDVPTDILIVGSVDQKNLEKVVSGFEAQMGHEINYTLMPREEFLYRKQITDRFLFSILEGDKIVMINKLKEQGAITPVLKK